MTARLTNATTALKEGSTICGLCWAAAGEEDGSGCCCLKEAPGAMLGHAGCTQQHMLPANLLQEQAGSALQDSTWLVMPLTACASCCQFLGGEAGMRPVACQSGLAYVNWLATDPVHSAAC